MTAAEPPAGNQIRIGVSSCLVGEEVRFNGGHKRDPFLTGTLARMVQFVPVCPEVEVGMGVPRETLRLVRNGDEARLLTTKTGVDHTAAMRRFSRQRVAELLRQDLSGFLLKKDSPSCGVFRVKLYDHNGVPSKTGRGLFAEELVRQAPHLPVEEEGRLHDPRLRENFFERVFAYRRLVALFQARWTRGQVVAFHTREKMLLRSHNESAYRELGRLVAEVRTTPRAEFKDRYQELFLGALKGLATTRRHTNVLQHMVGYFRKSLSAEERAELLKVIEDYRQELVPLVVPLTLVRHFAAIHRVEYLADQTYLSPHPKELMLRNHV